MKLKPLFYKSHEVAEKEGEKILDLMCNSLLAALTAIAIAIALQGA